MTARHAVMRHVSIRGRVQGVGYRAWVGEEAERRNLDGWVRNRRDGSVEAVFSGSEDVVATMIGACRRGPALARVDAIDERAADAGELDLRKQGERFSVLSTL